MRTHYCFGERRTGELDAGAIRSLLATARTRQAAMQALPVDDLLLVLERVGAAWADPENPRRRRVLAELPAQIGFSEEMVTLELQGLTVALSRPYLEGKLHAELGRVDAQDLWHRKSGSPALQKALPRGVVLHVASGNVSTTGVLSLVEGLLTRNVNLLKVASKAPLMPLLFAETLAELDHTGVIASSIAILSWSGEREPLHEVFCREADAIVVWGGEDVLETYRSQLGPATRLVGYGPKVSAGFIGAEALTAERVAATARLAARDIALWDQNACSSPQSLYLEDPTLDREGVARFVAALGPALDALALELPMGALDRHEQAEITKERELALSDALLGLGELHTPAGQSWTIIVDHGPDFRLSPLFRTIILKPVASLEAALPALQPYRHHLQTAGLAVAPARVGALAGQLFALGALRVTRIGEMSGGMPGEPHDGVYGLHELVRWVSLDTPEAAEAFDGTAFLSRAEEGAIALAKRRRLVASMLTHAPYYRAHVGPVTLRSEEDWLALPLLDKSTLVANTPPAGTGLFTEVPAGGHWLRTGGSTGDPTLSVYSFEDYEADMWRAARGAHAAGLRRGEKVANLFFAGDLYGSFLSLNRALELVGCNGFPYTNHAPIESVLHGLRTLGIETVIGLSSWVQAVLAEAIKDPRGIRVRHVLYAGEPFHPSEQARLRTHLGVERITSIGYGGVDAGPMGFQCTAGSGGGVHHVHADHVYLEILDPETWRPVTGGGAGEIVITSLNRRLMPFLRYRVGDRGRWVAGDCPCGLASPRFELLGRVDDRIRLSDMDFHYGDVQEVLAGFDGLKSSPQVVLKGEHGEPWLEVRAERDGDDLDEVMLAEAVREGLIARLPGLAQVALQVTVLPPGSLERVGRTGKIIRLIDHRGQRS